MSIRIRSVGEIVVAICAARSVAKPGDVYLDDAAHHALSTKFWDDFASEGSMAKPPANLPELAVMQAEESNNAGREEWDRTFGTEG